MKIKKYSPVIYKIRRISKFFRLVCVTTVHHPKIIFNGLIFLLTYGPTEFIIKLKDFEKKVKLGSHSKTIIFINLLKKLIKLIKQKNILLILLTPILRIAFAPVYVIFFSIYFLFFKLIDLVFFLFKRSVVISQNQYELNGISIAMLTWNKKQLLKQTLTNLIDVLDRSKLTIPYEVIVVDNGSKDGTVSMLQTNIVFKKKVKLVALDKNYGFSKGYNLSLKQAKYNWIYIINNDMLVQKDTFTALIKAYNKIKDKSKIFSLSSQIFFFDPKKRREESGKTYIRYHHGYLDIAHEVEPRFLDKQSNTLYFGGGSALINKHLFYQLGGFEEKIIAPYYSEDLDLGYRAWKYGFRNIFVPESKVIHYHRATNINHTKVDYIIRRNALFFILKNFDDFSLVISHLIFYPLKIIAKTSYFSYGLSAVCRFHWFVWARLKSIFLKKIYSDRDILIKQYEYS